jgi:hypothetical protein
MRARGRWFFLGVLTAGHCLTRLEFKSERYRFNGVVDFEVAAGAVGYERVIAVGTSHAEFASSIVVSFATVFGPWQYDENIYIRFLTQTGQGQPAALEGIVGKIGQIQSR